MESRASNWLDHKNEKEKKGYKIPSYNKDFSIEGKDSDPGEEEKNKCKTPTEIIDLICELAKKKDKNRLLDLKNSGVSLSISNGIETACKRLASEAVVDIDALELLVKMSEKSLDDATEGAALAGHTILVEKLLHRGASPDSACIGAGIGKNFALLKIIAYHVNNNYTLTQSMINHFALGVAQRGDVDMVRKLIKHKNFGVAHAAWFRYPASLEYVISGAALRNKVALVMYLINHADVVQRKRAMLFAVMYAAASQGFELMNEMIRLWNDMLHSSRVVLDAAVKGAACSGNASLVDYLIKRGASRDVAVENAAYGAHMTLVDTLLNDGASLYDAIIGAARKLHFALLDNLIRREKRLSGPAAGTAEEEIKKASGNSFSHVDLALFVARQDYCDTSSPPNKRSFYSGGYKLIEEMTASGPSSTLQKKANELSTFFRKTHLSVDQALAWEEPEIQGIMVLYRLGKYLQDDAFFIVATYLSPFIISEKEAKKLFTTINKEMPFKIRGIEMTMDLRAYGESLKISNKPFAFFKGLFGNQEQSSLALKIKAAASDNELDEIISEAILLNNKGPLHDILQSHQPKP